jgi:hypothetical protein
VQQLASDNIVLAELQKPGTIKDARNYPEFRLPNGGTSSLLFCTLCSVLLHLDDPRNGLGDYRAENDQSAKYSELCSPHDAKIAISYGYLHTLVGNAIFYDCIASYLGERLPV